MSARPRRILVCFDGSQAGRHALEAATDFMSYGSTIAVLAVDDSNGAATALLDEAREGLRRKHVFATYLEGAGDPVDEIVATADRLETDLVVVARGGAGRDDAAELVRRVPCSVLVVE